MGLMKGLSDMYEMPSVNNKVFLMKKLFHLKMREGVSMATHFNEFNTIVNQLSYVEIDFDDEVCDLILWTSLPNSWEPMRTVVSNFVSCAKLKFNDARDWILAMEVYKFDSGEASTSSFTLNLESRGRENEKNSNQNKGRSKSRNERSNSRFGKNVECRNCRKIGHIKKYYRPLRKNEENKDDIVSVVIEDIHDVLLLSVKSSIDSWVLDLGASSTLLHIENL